MFSRDQLQVPVVAAVVVLLVVFTFAPLVSSGQADDETDVQTARLSSGVSDVRYNVTFYRSNLTLRIQGKNPGGTTKASHVIRVDNTTIAEEYKPIKRGDRWRDEVNITNEIHGFRESHEVTVSTWGDSVTFEFERDVDASRTTTVPVPTVTNVSLTTTTYLGDRYAAVNVTMHNPSVHAYLVSAMADTTRTNGIHRAVGLRNHTTNSVTVPLKQPPGEVHGEVRIYGGQANEADDALTQVEFHGVTNGSTTFREEPYVPVPEPAFAPEGQQYRYRRDDRALPGDTVAEAVGGWNRLLLAAALVLLLGLVWWRRR